FGLWHCASSAFSQEGLKMTQKTNQALFLQARLFGAIPKPILPCAKVFVHLFQKVAPRERVLLQTNSSINQNLKSSHDLA
ncbi:MAG: hypothetical protein J6B12_02595, partial [Clostridia bacterium]|nr:hypothetical protein [Clostridia bacterium]